VLPEVLSHRRRPRGPIHLGQPPLAAAAHDEIELAFLAGRVGRARALSVATFFSQF